MVSLRKLVLVAAMSVLMLVTLFPSYVKADVGLSQEFVDPIKNWSFEEVSGSPCALADWSTNNGGWQDLRSDINGNGEVDFGDVGKIYLIYSGQITGPPELIERSDVNCNGLTGPMDLGDVAKVYSDYSQQKEPHHIDGSYSWYTNGGGVVDGYETNSESIYPSDDSYVCQDDPDSISNSEVPDQLCVYYWKGYFGIPWLKFTVPSGYQVTKAEVRLYQNTWSNLNNPVVSIHYSTDNSWSEETITWNNQPTFGGALDSKVVSNPNNWFSWDVSSVISSLGTFSFCLTTETSDGCACFWSKDYDGLDPYLYIKYSRPVYSYIMTQFLDSATVQAVAGKTVMFSFYFYPESVVSDGSQNNGRAEIYYEYPGGSNTVYGVWIAPTEFNWWNAYVTASLPSTVTAVKVVIHGKPDFKAYIDSASFSIFDHETKEESGKGKLTLGVNIYEWHVIGGAPQPNGKVFLLPTLYAESSSEDYKIQWIELKVELLPNDGSSTTQNGFIDIRYCAQENNEGRDVEPASPEKVEARTLESAAQLITFGTSILIGIGVGIIAPEWLPLYLTVLASASASATTGAVIKYTLQQFASEPVDEHAQMGTDYFVRERWEYPTSYKEYQPEPFVESVSGQYTLDWTFNTASASSFQIKATATVNWGKVVYQPSHQTFDWWYLEPAGSTSISKITTIQL
jgi:hypothetical protein